MRGQLWLESRMPVFHKIFDQIAHLTIVYSVSVCLSLVVTVIAHGLCFGAYFAHVTQVRYMSHRF